MSTEPLSQSAPPEAVEYQEVPFEADVSAATSETADCRPYSPTDPPPQTEGQDMDRSISVLGNYVEELRKARRVFQRGRLANEGLKTIEDLARANERNWAHYNMHLPQTLNSLMQRVDAINTHIQTTVTDIRTFQSTITARLERVEKVQEEIQAQINTTLANATVEQVDPAMGSANRKRQRDGGAHSCLLCAEHHTTENCHRFPTPEARRDELVRQNRCLTCGRGHAGLCRFANRRCPKCPPTEPNPFHLLCICTQGPTRSHPSAKGHKTESPTPQEQELQRMVFSLVQQQLNRMQDRTMGSQVPQHGPTAHSTYLLPPLHRQ